MMYSTFSDPQYTKKQSGVKKGESARILNMIGIFGNDIFSKR